MKIPQASNFSRREWEEAIDQYIFDEKHRAILKRNLLDGVKYERLAEEFGCSRDKIARLVPKLSAKLFKHI
jgi:AraC-like DNA-binding protein